MNEMRGCSIFCAIRPVSGCREQAAGRIVFGNLCNAGRKSCKSEHQSGRRLSGLSDRKSVYCCNEQTGRYHCWNTGRTEIQRFLSQMRYPHSQHRLEKASACIQPPLSSDLPADRRRPRNGLHGVWHWERPLVFPSDRPIQWGTAGNGGLPERTTLLFCLSEMYGSQKKTVIELFLVSKAEE